MARERGGIPSETLMGLRRRLAALPRRDPGRRAEVGRIAELFGVSSSTVYRALASMRHLKGLRRADRVRICCGGCRAIGIPTVTGVRVPRTFV